jgi:hypothetical protein
VEISIAWNLHRIVGKYQREMHGCFIRRFRPDPEGGAGQRLTATGLPSRKCSSCGVQEPPVAPLRSGWIVSLI